VVAEEPVSKPVLWFRFAAMGLVLAAVGALIVSLVPTEGPVSQSKEQGPADPQAVFRAGEAIEIWHAGKWYPGRVQATADAEYFVNYDGFSKSWYEWVDATRLRRRP
jgi:hypothetical protein